MISRGTKAKTVRIHHALKIYNAIILYTQIEFGWKSSR